MALSTPEIDSPVRHRRSAQAIAAAVFRKDNYLSVIRAFRYCDHPVDLLWRYILNSGAYPAIINMKTPIGKIEICAYTSDDIQTIHEIFLKGDYQFEGKNDVVVDFGSNIGISALYFLSRSPDAFIYCYEPLAQNTERLKATLARYAGRFHLKEVAVGERNEIVTFGWEPTGRYGGVNRDTGRTVSVPCLDSNEQLQAILERHQQIDLLKIDIETLESVVTERIPVEIARRIRHIVVEYAFRQNPLIGTHTMKCVNNITKFWSVN